MRLFKNVEEMIEHIEDPTEKEMLTNRLRELRATDFDPADEILKETFPQDALIEMAWAALGGREPLNG